MGDKSKHGITISPKWISIIIVVIGLVWSASAAYTSLQAGQEQLSQDLKEHLTGNDKIVDRLDSLIAVVNHHLQWDTLYVVSQGYLDQQQQEDIKDMLERLREVENR